MCAFCKGTETKYMLDKFLVSLDEIVLIVKNVPSMECVQCGEKFYTDEVSKELENIANRAKQMKGEILVVDYNNDEIIEVVR